MSADDLGGETHVDHGERLISITALSVGVARTIERRCLLANPPVSRPLVMNIAQWR